MYEVVIECFELVGVDCKVKAVGTVLRADVSSGLIAGEDKNFAIEWAKNQVKNIVKNAIEVGSKSNIEIWSVDSVLNEKNLDADFIFFFTNPEGDYRKFNFTIKVN